MSFWDKITTKVKTKLGPSQSPGSQFPKPGIITKADTAVKKVVSGFWGKLKSPVAPGADLPIPKFVEEMKQKSPIAKLTRGESLKSAFGVENFGKGPKMTRQEALDLGMSIGPQGLAGFAGSLGRKVATETAKKSVPKIISKELENLARFAKKAESSEKFYDSVFKESGSGRSFVREEIRNVLGKLRDKKQVLQRNLGEKNTFGDMALKVGSKERASINKQLDNLSIEIGKINKINMQGFRSIDDFFTQVKGKILPTANIPPVGRLPLPREKLVLPEKEAITKPQLPRLQKPLMAEKGAVDLDRTSLSQVSQIGEKMSRVTEQFDNLVAEFKSMKTGDSITKPTGLVFVGKVAKDVVKTLGIPNDTVITRQAIKHIVERRGENALEFVRAIPDVLANPTKVADNSAKRLNSFLFAKMNGSTKGVVIEVTKTPDGNRVVSAFPIDRKTYDKLVDISGRADVPPFAPRRSGRSQQILSDVRDDSIPRIAKPVSLVKPKGVGIQVEKSIQQSAKHLKETVPEVRAKYGRLRRIKDNILEYIQNKEQSIKRLVERKDVKITDISDPYLKSTLYSGRVADKIAVAKKESQTIINEAKTLANSLKKDLQSVRKEINDFLIARHAPERNLALGEKAAGISTAEAAERLKTIKASPQGTKIEAIANKIQTLNNKTLDTLKEGGVISDELYTKLRTIYKNHVPLQRVFEETNDMAGALSGAGFNVRATGIKRAVGSEREVSDILGNVIHNYEQAVLRSEKNIVDSSTLAFIRNNEKVLGDLFEIQRPKMIGKDFKGRPLLSTTTDPHTLQMFEKGKRIWMCG